MMSSVELRPERDYPLAANRPELLKTPTGKRLDDLTMEAVLAGEVGPDDLRIAPDTLRLQAQIADSVGRPQLGENFRRAAELTAIPDEKVLAIYNALRPRASTKEGLLELASELDGTYRATLCAQLVREAADVYERRGILAD
jgi:propanediol dehydratase small subunit